MIKRWLATLSSVAKETIIFTLLVFSGVAFAYDCNLSTVRCVGPGEEYNTTGVTHVETVFQSAVDAAQPGDIVAIRGGTYSHDIASPNQVFLSVSVSGTSGNPITITSQEGENARISGFGFTEGATDAARSDEVLIEITGNYIHVQDLELSDSAEYMIVLRGDYNVLERLYVHDGWGNMLELGQGDADNNIIRHSEFARSRHGTGIVIAPLQGSPELQLENNIIEYNISHSHGREPDGSRVPPATGDPAGGGNSDAIAAGKLCQDFDLNANICPGNIVRYNVGFSNIDDGFDFSLGEGSKIIGNISFSNGPEGGKGYKILSYVTGGLYHIANVSIANSGRGFEPRHYDNGAFINNLSASAPNHGISYAASINDNTNRIINNVVVNNTTEFPDMTYPTAATLTTNWLSQSNGDPSLPNNTFSPSSITTGVEGADVQTRIASIVAQVKAAFQPAQSSPLVDAGTFVADVHCATADDDPTTPHDANDPDCLHWAGSAPDIGPFEYGLTGGGGTPSTARLKVPTNISLQVTGP